MRRIGERAFSFVAPRLLNEIKELPGLFETVDVKTFASKLHYYLNLKESEMYLSANQLVSRSRNRAIVNVNPDCSALFTDDESVS